MGLYGSGWEFEPTINFVLANGRWSEKIKLVTDIQYVKNQVMHLTITASWNAHK